MTEQAGLFVQIARSKLEPILVQAQFTLTAVYDEEYVIYDRNPEMKRDIYRVTFDSAGNSPELDIELGEFHWLRVYMFTKKRNVILLGEVGQRRSALLPDDPQLRGGWLYATQEQLNESVDEIAEILRGILRHDDENIA